MIRGRMNFVLLPNNERSTTFMPSSCPLHALSRTIKASIFHSSAAHTRHTAATRGSLHNLPHFPSTFSWEVPTHFFSRPRPAHATFSRGIKYTGRSWGPPILSQRRPEMARHTRIHTHTHTHTHLQTRSPSVSVTEGST